MASGEPLQPWQYQPPWETAWTTPAVPAQATCHCQQSALQLMMLAEAVKVLAAAVEQLTKTIQEKKADGLAAH